MKNIFWMALLQTIMWLIIALIISIPLSWAIEYFKTTKACHDLKVEFYPMNPQPTKE